MSSSFLLSDGWMIWPGLVRWPVKEWTAPSTGRDIPDPCQVGSEPLEDCSIPSQGRSPVETRNALGGFSSERHKRVPRSAILQMLERLNPQRRGRSYPRVMKRPT